MYPSDFSGNSLYNLKLMSKDGRKEGVYINAYGDNNNNPNKGKACTEKTDTRNMGTYNYSGMYYKDGLVSFLGSNHVLWDVFTYYRLGNVSKDDLPKDSKKTDSNQNRYDDNIDAKKARAIFEESWVGIKE